MDSNINKSILLIGAGQLGSRHLQGLLKLEGKQVIYILDPSVQSLDLAKIRANEITNEHTLHFINDWGLLPENFDLAIVATNANVRELVVTRLLEDYNVTYLVLEKVLFQQLASYSKIGDLINEKKVQTWVNHPRRLMEGYQGIKAKIEESNFAIQFNVVGGNWGLGCNSLHFIDLFTFITGSNIESIDAEWVDNVIHESKRENFIEFTGTIKGRTKNNSCFTLNSFQGEQEPITLYISSPTDRWFIYEAPLTKVVHLSKSNGFNDISYSFQMEFQSSLTTSLAKNIFEQGNCSLPDYFEASRAHKSFISAMLTKYNNLTGLITDTCPIT